MKKTILTAFYIWFQIVAFCAAEITVENVRIATGQENAIVVGSDVILYGEGEISILAGALVHVGESDKMLELQKKEICDGKERWYDSDDAKLEPAFDTSFKLVGLPGVYRIKYWQDEVRKYSDDILLGGIVPVPIDPIDPPTGDYAALIRAIDAAADSLNDPDTRGMMAAGYAAVATALKTGGTIEVSYAGETHRYDVTTIEVAQLALAEKAREAMWNRKDQSKNWFQFRKTASKLVSDAIGDSTDKVTVSAVLMAVSAGLSQQTTAAVTGHWETQRVCFPNGTCQMMRVWVQ